MQPQTGHFTAAYDNFKDKYRHNVQLYMDIPIETISLLEFEDLAHKRFLLFKLIESATNEDNETYSVEWEANVLQKLKSNSFYNLYEEGNSLDPSVKALLTRRKEHISHFILRLACCETENLWSWFINRELEWFYIKYQMQTDESKKIFLKSNKLNYVEISNEEKFEIYDFLKDSTSNFTNDTFYKVDIKECFRFIGNRSVYLNKGYAYIPSSALVFCVMNRYNTHLKKMYLRTKLINMREMIQKYSFVLENIRKFMSFQHSINERPNYFQNFKVSHINKYSKRNFPLCMKYTYDTLKRNHHLKYGGRCQLGNFIKNIGINLEDALAFWKREFVKKMPAYKFDKKYAYHIRHNYGKAGSMREYKPDCCETIIKQKIGPSECHGCPFKTYDPLKLGEKLREDRMDHKDIDIILEEVNKNKYQMACTKYFEIIHYKSRPDTIKYPHEYFKESLSITGEIGEESDEEEEDMIIS